MSKIKSLLGLAVIIGLTGLLLVAFIDNNWGGVGSNALASQLASYKTQEIEAENQINLWSQKKTEATKKVIEMNGKISESVKKTNPEAKPFQ
jgi:hypothetical protein